MYLFKVFPGNSLYFCDVVSFLLFLILFMWALSLLFIMSLTKSFINFAYLFQRISSWFHWPFLLFFLKSVLFFPLWCLLFLPSYSFWSCLHSSSSGFRYKVKLLEIFLVSWVRRTVLLYISLLELILLCPIEFGWLCFYLYLSQVILISSLITFLTHSLVSSMLFSFHVFVFQFSSCNLFLVVYPCDRRRCLIWFQSS